MLTKDFDKDCVTYCYPVGQGDIKQALDFIDNDELLEITPKTIRIRKKILDPTLRKRAGFKK